jgi:ABC-type spermidine/putrescine transport system permease subunit II
MTAAPAIRGVRLRRNLVVGYAGAFYFFLYGPIFFLIVLSFNNSNLVGIPLRGFTTHWYAVVLGTPALMRAVANSIELGIVSASISTTIALMMAIGFRRDFPMKGLVMKLLLLPIVIPGIVGGVLLTVFFGYLGVDSGLWTTVLAAHITWTLPFAFLTLFPRLHKFDRSLEEAAMDLGATPSMVFRRILLPIVRPGIISTVLFAFTLSFDEFIRTLFVIGDKSTIPVYLWNLLSSEMPPYLPAVGVVIMLISVSVSLVGFAATRRAAPARG